MDIDVEFRTANLLRQGMSPEDIVLLILQEQQVLSAQQAALIEQQNALATGQQEIQRDVHLLSSSARKGKGPSRSAPTDGEDADDEESGSDDSGDEVQKEKMPRGFHVLSIMIRSTFVS